MYFLLLRTYVHTSNLEKSEEEVRCVNEKKNVILPQNKKQKMSNKIWKPNDSEKKHNQLSEIANISFWLLCLIFDWIDTIDACDANKWNQWNLFYEDNNKANEWTNEQTKVN